MRYLSLALTVPLTGLPPMAGAHPVATAGGDSSPTTTPLLIHLLSAPDHAPLVLLALAAAAVLALKRWA